MCCTSLSHRRRRAADQLRCYSFIKASWYGRLVYEKFGFVYVDEYHTRREGKEGDTEWT